MVKKILNYLSRISNINKINLALARAAATNTIANLDPTKTTTWEFSAFSQNGEDGVINFLISKIDKPNRYFIEIGASDGLENNTSWLAIARKYSGIMIEGDKKKFQRLSSIMAEWCLGVECLNLFVNIENISMLKNISLHLDPDVFSLDIDGIDFYVLQSMLEIGFRPKIVVVEYNSAFGPLESKTIKYTPEFDFKKVHETNLYYGVSIAAWKKLLSSYGYKFITVDNNGVNAFFIKPENFDEQFVNSIVGLEFKENFYQLRRWKVNWEKQFDMIKDEQYHIV